MDLAAISDIGQYVDREVEIRGWLYNLRESGKLLFPIFRDGTGTIQGVVSLKDQPVAFGALRGLTQESSVIVTGIIHADVRAPGGFEIQITAIEVVQRVPDDSPYPIQLKEHGVDFLLDHRHLWIRTPRQAAILRIRAQAVRSEEAVEEALREDCARRRGESRGAQPRGLPDELARLVADLAAADDGDVEIFQDVALARLSKKGMADRGRGLLSGHRREAR